MHLIVALNLESYCIDLNVFSKDDDALDLIKCKERINLLNS